MVNKSEVLDRIHSMSPNEISSILRTALKEAGIECAPGRNSINFEGLSRNKQDLYEEYVFELFDDVAIENEKIGKYQNSTFEEMNSQISEIDFVNCAVTIGMNHLVALAA